ncbi:MAG: hypothetical protein WCJ75_13540 [Desulfomonile sp.]|jgi:hypothetical protein
MKLITPHKLLVCLVFFITSFAMDASAWYFQEAAFVANQTKSAAPVASQIKEITKVKEKKIVKCRPGQGYASVSTIDAFTPDCILPVTRPRGWELEAEALYARTKGKVRFSVSNFGNWGTAVQDVDMNSDLGLPEHYWIGSFSARYGFKPRWSVRYSVMPTVIDATASTNSSFNFGNMMNTFGQNTKVKWERLYQRIGLVYDPIRTPTVRVSVFGDYVRLNDKLSVVQLGCCGSTFDNDLNMAMAGLEFERCLKVSRLCNTLSVECKAGIAFGDAAVGSDLATGLKYSIPMNNGRWGFVKGGYRQLTFKKKYSDAKMMDTAMEGGFIEAGLIF